MRYFLISLFSIACSLSFFSCDDNDNFSSNPSLRVEFSNDTIRFDTIFTGLATPTKGLKVYNQNNNSLNISSIEVMNPETSGFRINVDGFAGNKAENVDLLKKDSLFIFIEVTVDPLNSDNPLLIRDSIRFNINGSVQYAYLEAVGQDVEVWMGGRIISQDTTITAKKPILIFDSIYVKKDATLTIEKDVKLYFHNKAKVLVKGRINAKGTAEQPVVFRGDRLDNLFTFVPYDRVPGQWEGIVVDSASFDNHFEHVHIRNAVNAFRFEKSDPTIKKASFISSIVHNSTSDGIYAEDCWIEGRNSLFTNSWGHTLNLVGGQYEFIHCTVANYFSWRSMGRQGKALRLANTIEDENKEMHPRPLNRADFTNCIIAGSSYTEYVFDEKGTSFNYAFSTCVIKAREIEDANFRDITWKDPVLKKISSIKEGTNNTQSDYLFIFELDSISPAKNIANMNAATALPLDIRGVSRLRDSGPDIGCYEWIATE